jgi:hypothetical protein
MPRRSRGRAAFIVAGSLWALWLALHLLARGLAAANDRIDETSWIGLVANEIVALVGPTVGAIVASRVPRNPIGWIFSAVAVAGAFAGFAESYATYGIANVRATLPGAEAFAWSVGPITRTSSFVSYTFPLLLFPDGRLPSRRWRPVAWLMGVAAALIAVVIALRPEGLVGLGPVFMPNPLAVEAFRGLSDVVLSFIPLGLVVVVASVITRLRRASGLEREQFKWIGYAGGLMITLLGLAGIGTVLGVPALVYVGFGGASLAMPIAIGIAIVRYRLYDIDVLINRTLVYGATTATLVATYALTVVIAQLLLRPFTQGNELAVAASTLATAALIQPVRRRIQSTVDRRFYRSRYDAARTLDALAAHLRDEVDLGALRRELIRAVGETMEPAHASVWLRERAR